MLLQRQLDITPESLPRGLAELEVSGPRELVLDNGSFSRNLSGLNLVRLADVGRLTVERRAFARLAHPHLRLEVSIYSTINTSALFITLQVVGVHYSPRFHIKKFSVECLKP